MGVRATTSTTATVPFGIVDVYSGAAAAYSVRKLRGAYTGAAIRVRRSNDNAEQDIGFTILGDLDESALSTFVGVNSGFITTWYDQSGNSKNAIQTIAASQPRIVNSGVIEKENNVPIVRLLGANRMSTTSPVFSTGAASYYVHLIAKSANTSGGCLFSSGSQYENGFIGAFQATPNIERHAWWANDIDAISDLTVFKLRTYAYDGTTRYTYINKIVGASQVISGKNTASNNLFIGSNTVGSNIYQGAISELIIYNSDLNPQRIAIQDNAMSYYGIV